MSDATIKQVSDFFKAFSVEWKALSDESKQQLRAGIGDGSLTY